MAFPGGWNVVEIDPLTVPAGQSVNWAMILQGNGLATGGLIQVRMATPDGFKIDWNTTVEVLSAASPGLSSIKYTSQMDLPQTKSWEWENIPLETLGFDCTGRYGMKEPEYGGPQQRWNFQPKIGHMDAHPPHL